jgi:hypothetical protein
MAEPNETPPRKITLFSGHMIDAPGRAIPRFPPDREPIAAAAIGAALSGLAVLGLWQGRIELPSERVIRPQIAEHECRAGQNFSSARRDG